MIQKATVQFELFLVRVTIVHYGWKAASQMRNTNSIWRMGAAPPAPGLENSLGQQTRIESAAQIRNEDQSLGLRSTGAQYLECLSG